MQYRSSLFLALLLSLGISSPTLVTQQPVLGAAAARAISVSPTTPGASVPQADQRRAPQPGEIFLAEAADDGAANANESAGSFSWLLWLIPLVLVGAIAWGLSRRRQEDQSSDSNIATDEPQAVPPPPPSAAESETEAASPAAIAGEALAGTTPAVTPVNTAPANPEASNGIAGPNADNSIPPQPPVPPTAENGAPPADEPPTRPGQGAGGTSFAGAAGLMTGAAASVSSTEDQSAVEARKYNVVGRPVDRDINLSDVDDGLPDLPGGYGDSRIVLMPRDPEWAYAYWDISNQHKEELRRQGGTQLALRLYDVTGSSMQQQGCDELARSWYLRIPISDRDYRVEIGYLTNDGRWLLLASSNSVRVPPVYPSSWEEDLFASVDWDQDLQDSYITTLTSPDQRPGAPPSDDPIYAAARRAEAQRLSGSLYGSMQHLPGSIGPEQAISSYAFPSGIGMGLGAAPTPSGLNVSGLTMSGVGFSASAPPIRPRKFWLVADAELIVYGATEPDATVTIGGQPIQLEPDGTFRFQMSFQDGNIDYPIMAVASDGEQSRSIHMTFDRETPRRHTNTKDEAQDEWPC